MPGMSDELPLILNNPASHEIPLQIYNTASPMAQLFIDLRSCQSDEDKYEMARRHNIKGVMKWLVTHKGLSGEVFDDSLEAISPDELPLSSQDKRAISQYDYFRFIQPINMVLKYFADIVTLILRTRSNGFNSLSVGDERNMQLSVLPRMDVVDTQFFSRSVMISSSNERSSDTSSLSTTIFYMVALSLYLLNSFNTINESSQVDESDIQDLVLPANVARFSPMSMQNDAWVSTWLSSVNIFEPQYFTAIDTGPSIEERSANGNSLIVGRAISAIGMGVFALAFLGVIAANSSQSSQASQADESDTQTDVTEEVEDDPIVGESFSWGNWFSGLHAVNQRAEFEARQAAHISDTVARLRAYGVTEAMIRENWRGVPNSSRYNNGLSYFGLLEKQTLYYLITGVAHSDDVVYQDLQSLPESMRLSPIEAIRAVSGLSDFKLDALFKCFYYGLRTHHLTGMRSDFSLDHAEALNMLFRYQQDSSIESIVSQVNEVDEGGAWNISRRIYREQQSQRDQTHPDLLAPASEGVLGTAVFNVTFSNFSWTHMTYSLGPGFSSTTLIANGSGLRQSGASSLVDKPVSHNHVNEKRIELAEKVFEKFGYPFPEMPREYLCPITLKVMDNPVTAGSSNQAFEYAYLKRWVETHETHPITRERISVEDFKPADALKKEINQFIGDLEPVFNFLKDCLAASQTPADRIHRHNQFVLFQQPRGTLGDHRDRLQIVPYGVGR